MAIDPYEGIATAEEQDPYAGIATPEPISKPEQVAPVKKQGFAKTILSKLGDSASYIADIPVGFVKGSIESAAKRGEQAGESSVKAPTAPEKALQIAGQGAGFVGDVGMEALNAANKIVATVPGSKYLSDETLLSYIPESWKKKIAEKVGQGVQVYGEVPERARKNIEAAANIATTVPIGAIAKPALPAARQAIKSVAEGAGNKIKDVGKDLYLTQLKPKDATAKLAGSDVAKGAENLMNIFDKNNLHSATGGIKAASKKAQAQINKNQFTAENLIKKAASDPNTKVDVDASLLELMEDIQSGKSGQIFLQEDQSKALKIIDDIHQSLSKNNLTGTQPLSAIPEIKKTLSEGMHLFKKGKYGVAQDPIRQQAGELAYLKLMEQLNDQVPGLKEINSNTHDLIIAKKAADEATKRIGNKNKIGLTDLLMVLGLNTTKFKGTGEVGLSLPGVASAVIAKKALGSGRGPSAFISAGKGLESAATEDIFGGR